MLGRRRWPRRGGAVLIESAEGESVPLASREAAAEALLRRRESSGASPQSHRLAEEGPSQTSSSAPDINMIDALAFAAINSEPLFHLTGCTAEERLMIERGERILNTPQMRSVREALRTMSMTPPGLIRSTDTVESIRRDNLRRAGLDQITIEWVLRAD